MSFLQTSELKSTILITGGASGIGFSLAKRFIALGHEVIVCGRRLEQLALAKSEAPSLRTIQADLSTDEGRKALHEAIMRDFPKINVLINNAGIAIGEPVPLKDTTDADWKMNKLVIATNLEGPIHLSMLFLNHFLQQKNALIVNVSSLAAFIPFAMYPTYCATKGKYPLCPSFYTGCVLIVPYQFPLQPDCTLSHKPYASNARALPSG